MNDLKPVACRMKRLGEEIFIANEQDAILFAEQGWQAESVYTIPDTHRVVSAEFLERLAEETIYYAHKTKLRAIIDNKEPT